VADHVRAWLFPRPAATAEEKKGKKKGGAGGEGAGRTPAAAG
jgi:hypothetical protein